MKTILCYGDSNTWGYIGLEGGRYDAKTRWTGQLSQLLGGTYRIIEEGLNGRVIALDNNLVDPLNGKTSLPQVVKKYGEIDLILIMLGTNDLFQRRDLGGKGLAEGLFSLGKIAQDNVQGLSSTGVILITPSYVFPSDALEGEVGERDNNRLKDMEDYLELMVKDSNMYHFKASSVVTLTDGDGIHLTIKDHKDFALGIYKYIQGIII